jgi:hypothetical protein
VGRFGPGTLIEVRCKRPGCRHHEEGFFYTEAGVYAAGKGQRAIPEFQRCADRACGKPFCRGELGRGTRIEVLCRRKDCCFHRKPFRVVVV